MNTVHLIGRLTKDPKYHERAEGTPLTTMRIAVPRPSDNGNADFVTVACYDRLAQVTLDHLDKGDRVAVTGRLSHSEWTGDDGGHRERLTVVARSVDFLTDRPRDIPED